MKNLMVKFALAAFAVLSTMAIAEPAAAQATRTWVSGVGDDANPCSRTAPCRTFAGAISKTAAGGEINCIDPGAFGSVTIVKAMAIICDQVQAGVLSSGTNGIVVNAGVNDVVVLSGLDIEGFGTGINGIRFLAGGGLQVRNTTIRGYRTATSYGINFAPTSPAATLTLDNVTILNSGVGNGSGGIMIQPAANVAATFSLNNVRVTDNGGVGLRVDLTGIAGASVNGVVSNSVFVDDTNGVFVKVPTGSTAKVVIKDSIISANSGSGVVSQDVGSTVHVTGNTITQNGFGVRSLSSGALISYGNNVLAGNTTDGTFTGTVVNQ